MKMEIKLYHKHYDEKHLEKVIENMKKLGAPVIRGQFDSNKIFNAFEGCHRIRAAKELNIEPILVEVENDEDFEKLCAEHNESSGDYLSREDFEESVGDYYKAEFIEF
jgi:hypothetical protein